MPLEKPAVVAVDPAESAKRDELTAGHARSSPHVRGTGRDAHGRVAALGITPPRGEQSTQVETDRLYLESSPRVRETVVIGGEHGHELGIIPARAGSSNLGKRIVNLFRDHPRACGEQLVCCRIVTKGEGSSPRMRGAVCRGLCRAVRVGIIPACAGSRYKSRNQRGRIRDHPRVCEEQLIKSKVNAGNQGSSPRVRGAALRALFWSLGRGIIPACAGSSVNVVEPAAEQGGSSPRVRGAVMPSSSAICWNGIIPACAGSSAESDPR